MVAELSSQLAIAETADMTDMTETADMTDMTDRKLGIWGDRSETV
ncbi:hypothetical protein [uncultured Nostoc sp.]|nr:hypothetical protein [uncultured Nostoc sp.]